MGQHGVDLPALAAGAGDPNLVLRRKTAGGTDFLFGEHLGVGQASDLGVHDLAGFDLDPEMIQRPTLARVLQQHQLQRRISDSEVRIARLAFGWFGVKQLGVEHDCLIEILNVERQLNP